LFLRYNNKLSLTPAGEILLKGALSIDSISKEVTRQIEDIRDSLSRVITIGATGERTQRFLAKMILLLSKEYQDLHINIVEDTVLELKQKLKSGVIDLAVFAFNGVDEELDQIPLRKDEVVLALHENHRLANSAGKNAIEQINRINLSEMHDDPFVLLKKTTVMRQIADEYFLRAGFYPHELIETKGSYSSMVFVETGIAVGFIPKFYRYPSGSIRYLALENPFHYTIGIAHKKGAYLTRAMHRMIHLTKEYRNDL
jgi:DNA-binding transcriptional LysR family regulator